MSVFIDTGVFYAQHDRDAPRHEPAADTMGSLASGGYGRLYTSDYVYDETVTLTRTRTGRFDGAKAVGDRIRGVDPYSRRRHDSTGYGTLVREVGRGVRAL